MSRDLERIKRVVDAFERSDWAEIDVRVGTVRVHLVAGDHAAAPATAPPAPAAAAPAAAAPAAESSDVRRAADAAPSPTAPEAPPAGSHLVVSPSPGIFWRSPEPGAPPFADVGQSIGAHDTVCIVEVMKLMNHIKADVDGVVVAVYGANGVAVQKGEPLFAIVPAGTSA